MKAINNITAGLAGAVVLNVLHESAKRFFPNAPRVDLVGEEALTDILESAGIEPPKGNALYAATLAADIASNALYYSFIGKGKKENVLLRGAGIGLAAGIGALTLTKPLGLNDAPVNRTNTTKALTVAWYLVGGLVTALIIKNTDK